MFIPKRSQLLAIRKCGGYAANALRSGLTNLRPHLLNEQRDHIHAVRNARAQKPVYAMMHPASQHSLSNVFTERVAWEHGVNIVNAEYQLHDDDDM